jgi:hypothetical protein
MTRWWTRRRSRTQQKFLFRMPKRCSFAASSVSPITINIPTSSSEYARSEDPSRTPSSTALLPAGRVVKLGTPSGAVPPSRCHLHRAPTASDGLICCVCVRRCLVSDFSCPSHFSVVAMPSRLPSERQLPFTNDTVNDADFAQDLSQAENGGHTVTRSRQIRSQSIASQSLSGSFSRNPIRSFAHQTSHSFAGW